MHILTKRSLTALIAASTLAGSLALAGTALAAGRGSAHMNQRMPRPAVVGTVASISGTTLTVNAKNWQKNGTTTATTVYTVDASNAAVTKNGAPSTVSAIAAGDRVMIRGTVNGTMVTAVVINDGKALGRPAITSPKHSRVKTASNVNRGNTKHAKQRHAVSASTTPTQNQ